MVWWVTLRIKQEYWNRARAFKMLSNCPLMEALYVPADEVKVIKIFFLSGSLFDKLNISQNRILYFCFSSKPG